MYCHKNSHSVTPCFKKFKTRGLGCFPFPFSSRISNIRLTNIPFITVHPRIIIHPGPYHVIEGSNVTLPICHVTGYPAPVVTWRKSSGQLPQGRVEYNNSALHISHVRKDDSDLYFCSAVNLLRSVERKTLLVVISLPSFKVKSPGKVFVETGGTLILNCSATGDPQPVISWKRQGAALPVGRTQQINGALVIRHTREGDSGNYICAATSAGVFDIETVTNVEVIKPRGKFSQQTFSKANAE